MKRLCVLLFFILLACEDGPAAPDYGAATGNAASFGIWTPGANDDCTAAQHDAYSVVGPDHKPYPTWHPPIDPVRSCDRTTVVVGPATPANSPDGGGERIIPDRTCVDRDILVPAGQFSHFGTLHESWQTSNAIRAEGGHTLAFFNPYFQVSLPSRFYDPALAGIVGRPIDVCYEVTPAGNQASGGACAASTSNGTILGITFDDPRSVFDGTDRVVDINSNFISNASGPEVWFTDPFGKHGQTQPFPG